MGMGSLPEEPFRAQGTSNEFQRFEHRRTISARHITNRNLAENNLTSNNLTGNNLARARMARARWAEDLVAKWYEKNGYGIVVRNWHCREGELDIVAVITDKSVTTIAIVEVKARASHNFGTPLEAVTVAKQHKIRIATTKLLATRPDLRGEVRFDVVGVLGTQIEVLHNAF